MDECNWMVMWVFITIIVLISSITIGVSYSNHCEKEKLKEAMGNGYEQVQNIGTYGYHWEKEK